MPHTPPPMPPRTAHRNCAPARGARDLARAWTPVVLCAALLGAPTTEGFTGLRSGQHPLAWRHRSNDRTSVSTVTSSLSLPPGSASPSDGRSPVNAKNGNSNDSSQSSRRGAAPLPRLTPEDLRALNVGLPVQRQSRDGWVGSGMVAMDIKASPQDIWPLLLDFENYETLIDTVRRSEVRAYGANGNPDQTTATFVLSKFRFEVNVVHHFDRERQQLSFTLDQSSRNAILKKAEGVWHVQTEAEALRPGYTRVWLCSSIHVSRIVPRWIVDYAARRALPRATTWLPPTARSRAVEAAKALASVGRQQS